MTAPSERVCTQLITGRPGPERAAVIGKRLASIPSGNKITLILEGVPATVTSNDPQELGPRPDMSIHVLAPGCMCCIGNLALRVTLARVLRLERPRYLILAMIDESHRNSLVKLLKAHPYDAWLDLDGG